MSLNVKRIHILVSDDTLLLGGCFALFYRERLFMYTISIIPFDSLHEHEHNNVSGIGQTIPLDVSKARQFPRFINIFFKRFSIKIVRVT